jgi:hypothetical protein
LWTVIESETPEVAAARFSAFWEKWSGRKKLEANEREPDGLLTAYLIRASLCPFIVWDRD